MDRVRLRAALLPSALATLRNGRHRKAMTMRARSTIASLAAALLLSATVASAQSGGGAMADAKGRHSMDGQVTKVDSKRGWIDVKTSEGSMKLHFPPDALADVKKGDSVTVDLAIKDNGPAKKK
jgi:hypothetical protein